MKRSCRCASMWSRRSLFAYIRVKVTTANRKIRVRLLIALYVLHQLFMSTEGIAALIPGKTGIYARTALDTLHGLVLALIYMPPEELINVDIDADDKNVLVRMGTFGFGGGQ